jgi:hypothetical protein
VTEGQSDGHELIQVHFEGPLPSDIADIQSLHDDFKFAMDCATAFLNLSKAGMDEASRKVVAEGLWNAAVISYRRGFTTGKAHLQPGQPRTKIPKSWFEGLKPEYKEAHKEILEIANRAIAHRIGKNEHIFVCALLAPAPLPRALCGVGVLAARISPSDEQVRKLGSLCQGLVKGLSDRLTVLIDEFEKHVEQQDLDDLYTPSAGNGST